MRIGAYPSAVKLRTSSDGDTLATGDSPVVRDTASTLNIGFLALLLLINSACVRIGRPGNTLTARMPMTSYAQSLLGRKSGTVSIDFPLLELYDRSGLLLYHGTDESQNARFLRTVPRELSHLKPLGSSLPFKALLERVPSWRLQEGEIISRHHYALVSIGIAHCQSCVAQESDIKTIEPRLLRRGVDVLMLEIL